MVIAVRGSNLVSTASVSTYAVPIPAGSLEGDTALIFLGCGFSANTPAGWTAIEISTGGTWNGAVFRKELSAGDIATGTVTVTTTGAFQNVVGMVTFVGTIGSVRTSISSKNTAGAATRVLTTNSLPLTDNFVLYFGSTRGVNIPTSTAGTAMQTSAGTNASAVLKGNLVAANGALTSTFGYSGSGGDFQAIIVMSETLENNARIMGEYVEVIVGTDTAARMAGLYVEVLRTVEDAPIPLYARRRPIEL